MEYFDDEPCASGVERELVKELAKQAIDMCHVLVPEVKCLPVTLSKCFVAPVSQICSTSPGLRFCHNIAGSAV